MFHSIQLHLVGKSPFAGQDVLSLQIAVNHDNHGGIIVQITDDNWHGFFACQFAGSVSAMTGNDFISTISIGTGNRRNKHTIFTDAVNRIHHCIIVFHFEGMTLKRVEFRKRHFHYTLSVSVSTALFGREQIIDRCQLYVFRAAFQVSVPPSSDLCRLPQPYRWDRGHRCSFPRHWFLSL